MAPRAAIWRTERKSDAIAAELRREFENEFQAREGRQPARDPVLQTLFLAFAAQVNKVYEQAERDFPLAVLDDLVRGLGLSPRQAQPAQSVVQFRGISERERIGPEVALIGYAPTGEQLAFAPDTSIELQPAELRFAGVWEAGRLQVARGALLPNGTPLPQHRVPLDLRRSAPVLWLAIEGDDAHLGGLAVHLDVGAPGSPLGEALERSPWQMLSPAGTVRESGVMWSEGMRGGVRMLRWFHDEAPRPGGTAGIAADADVERVLDLGAGPYGGQVFVMPPVPADRRWRSGPPLELATTLAQLLPAEQAGALERPLVWLQIPLPAGTANVSTDLGGVSLNAVTASNVEIMSERKVFDRTGTIVEVHPEGEHRFLMGVLSVIGERGDRYAEMSELEPGADSGRFRVREGRIEFRPGKQATGRFDAYAVARLLLCDGAVANGIPIGGIRRVASALANVRLEVGNITATRGGADPQRYQDAKLRFAEQLRARDRVVTAADYEIACRSFDPRVTAAAVRGASEIVGGALRPVDLVTVTVERSRFADPDADFIRLAAQLTRHLSARATMGRRVVVSVQAGRER